MSDFQGFGLPAALMASLERMQYTTPTPIQAQAIPLAMQGKDILGSAATGTGKTGAFSIPMISKIMNSPRGSALVLTPTRELASQVMEVINGLLGKRSFIPTALLIGGDSMTKQCAALRFRPRIIVGTPGRINDHLERGNLILHDVNYLVLDETDRMLDMGFGIQIDRILKFLPPVRQTMLFSATLPEGIVKLTSKYLKHPERIAVDVNSKPHVNIKQEVLKIEHSAKFDELVNQIKTREGSIIVFVKTKRGADRIAERLQKMHLKVDAIHGDLHQRQRERVIQSFRDKRFRIMVATDIAARGLDIPHIEHVINYELPQCPEDYIHRIGRTARNGAEGEAICFVSPEEGLLWRDIQKLLNPGEPLPPLPKHIGKPSGGSRNGKRGSGRGPRNDSHRSAERSSGEAKGEHRQAKPKNKDSHRDAANQPDGGNSRRRRRRKPGSGSGQGHGAPAARAAMA